MLPLSVTVKEQSARLLAPSILVQVTRVVRLENVDPEAGLQVTVVSGQLSLTSAVKFTTAAHSPGNALAVMSPGQSMTGTWLSVTVIVKAQLVAFCEVSVAVQFTVVVPVGKKKPLGGLQFTPAPLGQLSVAATEKNTRRAH